MKYSCMLFVLIFFPLSVFAQNGVDIEQFDLKNQNSSISSSEHNIGGFMGINFKANFSENFHFILIGGGSFGIMVKPSISIFTSVNYLMSDIGGLEVWFAGIGAEYISFPYSWIQLYLYGKVSYGVMDFLYKGSSYQSGVFVFEPEALFGIRITKFGRIKLGIGYRVAAGISGLPVLTNRNCSGWYGVVRVNVGVFDPKQRQKVL